MPLPDSPSLYGIIDSAYLGTHSPAFCAAEMIAGGVDLLQIRAKGLPPAQIAAMAQAVLPQCVAAGVPLIINDFPEIAREVGAQGCHVGQDDLSVEEVRKIIGPGKIVGKSTHSMEQALAAMDEKPDYIGVGPVFPTRTKPDYRAVGLELVARVSQASREGRITVPFVCIGGITLENKNRVREAGGHLICVVSGILLAPDLRTMCRDLRA
ncbi:MAG: thiamine phosphate synthase [Verrucomicrobiae bacterium]|nr:thiamine phosphate synthase [Verrucomicrobiae bacterium]